MITGTDRPTESARSQLPDCLVEIGLAWLQRPLGGLTNEERAAAIAEICLIISQMRHRAPRLIEIERRRWVDRVTVRLCVQCSGVRGYEGAVRVELERRVLEQMLSYHDWREQTAPRLRPVEHTGPSEGGQVMA